MLPPRALASPRWRHSNRRRFNAPIGKLISLLSIAPAIGIAIYFARRNTVMPWTDAASIDADVVHVAAAIHRLICATDQPIECGLAGPRYDYPGPGRIAGTTVGTEDA